MVWEIVAHTPSQVSIRYRLYDALLQLFLDDTVICRRRSGLVAAVEEDLLDSDGGYSC